jgi:hypothetical protein
MGQARIKRINALKKDIEHCGTMRLLLENIKTEASVVADVAIAAIHARSFSGRYPEWGQMIKCQVCGQRHREAIKHSQVFARRWIIVNGEKVYTDEQLIAGKTPETEILLEAQQIRLIVGASAFKGKRKHPPLNRRANEVVQLTLNLVSDGHTREKALNKVRRILVKKYGRHGFLPPKWQRQKETNEKETTVQTV